MVIKFGVLSQRKQAQIPVREEIARVRCNDSVKTLFFHIDEFDLQKWKKHLLV